MLSEEAIKEYTDIYKKEFGITLSKAEATDQATRVLELFKILFREDKAHH